jgi:hypothetical protein
VLYPLFFFFFFSVIRGLFVVRSKKRERERDNCHRLISLIEENLSLSLSCGCVLFYARAFGKSAHRKKTQNVQHKPLSLSLLFLKCTRRDDHNARRKKRTKNEEVRSFLLFFFEAEMRRSVVSKITKTLNTENRRVKTSSNASDVRIK